MVSEGPCWVWRGEGGEEGARPRGCDPGVGVRESLGLVLLGTYVPGWWEKGRPRISLESGLQASRPAQGRPCSMARSACRLPARALPPSLPGSQLCGRARSSAPPSLPLRCEKAGAGRRRRRKAHARPLGSRLRAAGRASAVCACALRHCGFNSFRVCLQKDPRCELRVKHRISTILNQLWPGCDLSRDVFVFSESHKKYGEHFNSMP